MTTESSFDDERLGHLLSIAVRVACSNQNDPAAFLAWARSSIPKLVPQLLSESDNMALAAFWMGWGMWSGMPLPANGYRPQPLPTPGRNERCPCGSLKKYKQCCYRLDFPGPTFPPETFYPALSQTFGQAHWVAEIGAENLPMDFLLGLATEYAADGEWKSVKSVCEQALAESRAGKDERVGWLIPVLCDAYDQIYKTDRNKTALLARFLEHPANTLRSEANQRFAAMLHDRGDVKGAWAALHVALKATPDDPGVAGLEMTILSSEQEYERVQDRARFWLLRLKRQSGVLPEFLDWLEQLAVDPRGAMAEVGRMALPDVVNELLDWIDTHIERPIPALHWTALNADEQDGLLRNAFEPEPSVEQAALHHAWRSKADTDQPFSTQWLAGGEDEVWANADRWLPWLLAHPEALDCLPIVDDLARLLSAAELQGAGLFENPWLELLAGRGVNLLLHHWGPDREGSLPWLIPDNRPALRLLYFVLGEALDGNAFTDYSADALARAYLQLNPDDNHGTRYEQLRMLLKANDLAAASALIARFDDDGSPDFDFARALILFRSGRGGEAVQALGRAAEAHPKILPCLLKDTVKPPKLTPGYVTLGGDDQAWFYRDAMRDIWLADPQTAAWLRGAAAALRP